MANGAEGAPMTPMMSPYYYDPYAAAQMYGSTANLYGDIYGSNAALMGNLASAGASQANALTAAYASMYGVDAALYGDIYGWNTQANIAGMNNANALELAGIQSDDTRYVSNNQLAAAGLSANASMYGADAAKEASMYGADKNYEGAVYVSDNQLKGSMYGDDRDLEGTKYAADRSLDANKNTSLAAIRQAELAAQAQMLAPTLQQQRFNALLPQVQQLFTMYTDKMAAPKPYMGTMG